MSVQNDQVALVITFGDGADATAFCLAEPDESLNVDAEGGAKSSFVPGDPFYFLLQWDTGKLNLGSVSCSSGMVQRIGQVSRSHNISDVQAINADTTIELPHIGASLSGGSWCGNKPSLGLIGRKVSFNGALPARGQLSYAAVHELWRYMPPPASAWTPMINNQWLVVIAVRFDEAP